MRSVSKSLKVFAFCKDCGWSDTKEAAKKETAKQHAWAKSHTVEFHYCHVSTYVGQAKHYQEP